MPKTAGFQVKKMFFQKKRKTERKGNPKEKKNQKKRESERKYGIPKENGPHHSAPLPRSAPSVGAHIMRPQCESSSGSVNRHRSRSVGAQCAPGRKGGREIASGRISCAHRAGPGTIKSNAVPLSPWAHNVRPDERGAERLRRGAYHAPTERDRERSKATQFLSHRGRTVCAPTERDAFPSSAS